MKIRKPIYLMVARGGIPEQPIMTDPDDVIDFLYEALEAWDQIDVLLVTDYAAPTNEGEAISVRILDRLETFDSERIELSPIIRDFLNYHLGEDRVESYIQSIVNDSVLELEHEAFERAKIRDL